MTIPARHGESEASIGHERDEDRGAGAAVWRPRGSDRQRPERRKRRGNASAERDEAPTKKSVNRRRRRALERPERSQEPGLRGRPGQACDPSASERPSTLTKSSAIFGRYRKRMAATRSCDSQSRPDAAVMGSGSRDDAIGARATLSGRPTMIRVRAVRARPAVFLPGRDVRPQRIACQASGGERLPNRALRPQAASVAPQGATLREEELPPQDLKRSKEEEPAATRRGSAWASATPNSRSA